jgi:uncharacterized membrane protein
MEFILKYIWIIFIISSIANASYFKKLSKEYVSENPELEKTYDGYIKNFLIFGNIPWVIMGLGMLTGMTDSILEYFNPREMNPIVLMLHASIIMIYILAIRWIYFKNGAEFIEKHPGLMRKSTFSGKRNVTAKEVKLFFPLPLLGGIIAMVAMWTIGFPIEGF